jgi:hypothetical protein
MVLPNFISTPINLPLGRDVEKFFAITAPHRSMPPLLDTVVLLPAGKLWTYVSCVPDSADS